MSVEDSQKPNEIPKEQSMLLQKEMIAGHYDALAHAGEEGRKVVYTFVPGNLTELMRSFDVLPVLPEINALQSGMRKLSAGYISEAEKQGHSEDVCTYVKCDIGMLKKGNVGPTGAILPEPDLLLLSYTGCFTFMKWFELLRQEYDCPVAMLHVPYQADGHIHDHHRDYIVEQLETEVIPKLEQITGRRFDEDRLRHHLELSAQAEDDLVWVLESAKNKPSPIDAYFGGVYYIGPMFTAFRGTDEGVDYYQTLRTEIEERLARRKGPITPHGELTNERYRLVMEGPPNWTSFREFWQMFYDEGAVVVASSYTKVGGLYDRGFRHDARRPLETLAEYCMGCYTNLGLPSRVDLIADYIREYRADGFMINSVKSCNSFSVGQLLMLRQLEERTGVPGGFIESDLVDPRYFSAANIKNRIESYLQMLEQKKGNRRVKFFVGVDLGSTTTKAVMLDEDGNVIGRGITNSRSNYEVASRVAREDALVTARFNLTSDTLAEDPALENVVAGFIPQLERTFRLEQYRDQLARLGDELQRSAERDRHREIRRELGETLDRIVGEMKQLAGKHFGALAVRKSDFFRDLAGADYMTLAERYADPAGINFETLSGLFDQAILPVENSTSETGVDDLVGKALDSTLEASRSRQGSAPNGLKLAVERARGVRLEEVSSVGTGYGRQRLPFPKEQIRSEILCHGLGAHVMFPATRTVLDIGGQDTKAIQVDERGIVTSFQMNDRCAAGCGRYLGYIADEMNLGVHELGPLAQQATCHVKINSTCTVFAGAELRERLSLGQKREDILAGLHRAIVLRAMSLLARSGGIEEEFTFTGGVARNPAAVAALEQLVAENYGERTVNISAESIYTGALGAALFSLRAERKAA